MIDSLIAKGSELTNSVKVIQTPPGTMSFQTRYRVTNPQEYEDWLSSVIRYVRTNHKSDLETIEAASKKLSIKGHRKIVSTLKAIQILPSEPKALDRSTSGPHITINNHQNVSVNFLNNTIQDELSGKDYRELIELLQEYNSDNKKDKSKIMDKIKGLGSNVASNIIASILTNPSVLGGLL